MHRGIVGSASAHHRIEDNLRLLRGRRSVEIMPVVGQTGELTPNAVRVERSRDTVKLRMADGCLDWARHERRGGGFHHTSSPNFFSAASVSMSSSAAPSNTPATKACIINFFASAGAMPRACR